MSETHRYGYKAFDNNWECRGYHYKIGETATIPPEDVILCQSGFHYCADPRDLMLYWNVYPDKVKIGLVEDVGERTLSDATKSVTNALKVIREVPYCEWSSLVNSGKMNVGVHNRGDDNFGNFNQGRDNEGSFNDGSANTGIRNCGCFNRGEANSGDYNYGSHNAGNRNLGDNNYGNCNEGCFNVGDYNQGNHNIGFWNKGTRCYGIFNTEPSTQPCAFNKPLAKEDLKQLSLFEFSPAFNGVPTSLIKFVPWVLQRILYKAPMIEWVRDDNHHVYPPTGGHVGCGNLVAHDMKECVAKTVRYYITDESVYKEDRERNRENILRDIKQTPNFDPDIFKEITGIDVETYFK